MFSVKPKEHKLPELSGDRSLEDPLKVGGNPTQITPRF
jgi:hypothetical protein